MSILPNGFVFDRWINAQFTPSDAARQNSFVASGDVDGFNITRNKIKLLFFRMLRILGSLEYSYKYKALSLQVRYS